MAFHTAVFSKHRLASCVRFDCLFVIFRLILSVVCFQLRGADLCIFADTIIVCQFGVLRLMLDIFECLVGPEGQTSSKGGAKNRKKLNENVDPDVFHRMK